MAGAFQCITGWERKVPEQRRSIIEDARANGRKWGRWKRENPGSGVPEIPLAYQGGAIADAWREGYRAGLLGKK
jgi:hypothetical protein